MLEIPAIFCGPKYFNETLSKDPLFRKNALREEVRVYRGDESIGKLDGKYVFIDPKMRTYGTRIINPKEIQTL